MSNSFDSFISRLHTVEEWRDTADQALAFLSTGPVISDTEPNGPISSLRTARLYESRKTKGCLIAPGLDQTILSLGCEDIQVLGGHIETEQGVVVYWHAAGINPPFGLIVLRKTQA